MATESLTVLCPTRGRGDEQLQEVIDTFQATRGMKSTILLFILDKDDETPHSLETYRWTYRLPVAPGSMGAALNKAAGLYHKWSDAIGFIGDDHRFRSAGWDEAILTALKDGGIAYGDDGVQGEKLATQWFMTDDVYRALGWMALPECKHFYLDNAIMDIGRAANCLHYAPSAKIEHMHFSYGKSSMDETYAHTMRVGGNDQYHYNAWRNGESFQYDAYRVIGALEARKR